MTDNARKRMVQACVLVLVVLGLLVVREMYQNKVAQLQREAQRIAQLPWSLQAKAVQKGFGIALSLRAPYEHLSLFVPENHRFSKEFNELSNPVRLRVCAACRSKWFVLELSDFLAPDTPEVRRILGE